MKKFISYSLKVTITDENKIIQQINPTEHEKILIISNDFVTPTNSGHYFEFLARINNKNQFISTTSLRYFELEVEGMTTISIGIIDQLKYKKEKNMHIGWRDYSVGYHSDDGEIHSVQQCYPTEFRFGEIIGMKNIVGVGFLIDTNEVFFTCDGVLVKKIQVPYLFISAAIAVERCPPMSINLGEKHFAFNLFDLLN